MEPTFKNKNRGYQQLDVWHDAIELYRDSCTVFGNLPYELKRVASQQLASVDSVHRNIAEGYCRRGLREYLHHLYIAIASLGESVSGLMACHAARQLDDADFARLNSAMFKIENRLIRLISALESKQKQGDWLDHMSLHEEALDYVISEPNTPTLQYSTTPQQASL